MLPGILQGSTTSQKLNMKRMDSGPLVVREMRLARDNSFAAPNHNSRWCCAGERLSHTPIAQPPVDHPASRSQLPGKQASNTCQVHGWYYHGLQTSDPSIPPAAPLPVVESIGSSSMAGFRIQMLSTKGVMGCCHLHNLHIIKTRNLSILISRNSPLELQSSEAIQIILRCSTLGPAWHVYEGLRMLLMEAWFWCILCSSRILRVNLSPASSHMRQPAVNWKVLLKLPWVNSIWWTAAL